MALTNRNKWFDILKHGANGVVVGLFGKMSDKSVFVRDIMKMCGKEGREDGVAKARNSSAVEVRRCSRF